LPKVALGESYGARRWADPYTATVSVPLRSTRLGKPAVPLSWNEIRNNAHRFSKYWKDADSERSDAQTFWNEFFEVFGVQRKRVAIFEKQVEITRANAKIKDGRIDAFWKGELLIEHKSSGKDLDKAFAQAADYFDGLPARDLPRRILVSNFQQFRLYDLHENTVVELRLSELHKKVGLFGFIAGYQVHRSSGPEEVANVKAAEQLGRLHDQLKEIGYTGHKLEVLLVRLLFCLFAEDTGIFERNQFRDYLELRTSEDGSDLGPHLTNLFQVLNEPVESRMRILDEQLAAFAYVNGRLFAEQLPVAAFDRTMRETLLDATCLDWSQISPAIFGSLFQSIMDKGARRDLGGHYTRESNILKAIRPLFLDGLEAELAAIGNTARHLVEFQKRLASIRILDPACGCGNFLVIAYRELRRLELEVLHRLYERGMSSRALDVHSLVYVDVDQFYGIEIEEFPAQIAQVALWLMDHQMNLRVSEDFGQYFARLPLTKSPNIIYGHESGNALRIDWRTVIAPDDLTYIVGNPPFGGAKFISDSQRAEMAAVFHGTPKFGLLDYVCAWYRKAAEYMADNPSIRAAFVSTNSITQGEQVGVLWPDLFARGVRINFAHRTFEWTSEVKGKAAVHCVILGFALEDTPEKCIFEYDSLRSEPHRHRVSRINPYLVDGPDVTVTNREAPICHVPPIAIGNKPIDGGNYLFTPEQKAEFIAAEPQAAGLFKRWYGAEEFLNGVERWCLWVGGCSPADLRRMPAVRERVERVRLFRLASKSAPTQKLASTPTRFHVENIPDGPFMVIPEVSSERRVYLPMGFMQPDSFASNKLRVLRDATLFDFGVLSSVMHMAWMRYVTGRLKSDYQYSVKVVYNNFPWPQPIDKQRAAIEAAAQGVLDARALFLNSTLADLYDPVTMPPALFKAHSALDRAVDAAYGKTRFRSEAERVVFLFELYRKIAAPVEAAARTRRKTPARRRRTARRA
jgi:hypothetical protein